MLVSSTVSETVNEFCCISEDIQNDNVEGVMSNSEVIGYQLSVQRQK